MSALSRGLLATALLLLTTALAAPQVVPLALTAAEQEEGLLVPPTSARFSDPAWYEVIDARVLDGDLLRIEVELGAIDPSGGLPLGITQPIIELYLDTAPGGAELLLPGSGMRMPQGDGWNVALRITGDGAWAWQVDADGVYDLRAAQPLDVVASGRSVHILTPIESPPSARLYAITGVYDPFRPDGWRALTRAPSPWAFSSAELAHPVVAVFPGSPAVLTQALQRGELPRGHSATPMFGSLPWFVLMFAGLALAVLGLLRRRGAAAVRGAAVPSVSPGEAELLLIEEGEVDALLGRLEELVEAAVPQPAAVEEGPLVAAAHEPPDASAAFAAAGSADADDDGTAAAEARRSS